MTTFSTRNQSRKKCYRALGMALGVTALVTLIILSRRLRDQTQNSSTSSNSPFSGSFQKQRHQRPTGSQPNSPVGKKRKSFYDPSQVVRESIVKLRQPNGVSREVKGLVVRVGDPG